jgi:hypothetical protein
MRFPLARETADGYVFVWSYIDIPGMLAFQAEPDGSCTWMLKVTDESNVEFFYPESAAKLPAQVLELAPRFVKT